MPKANGKWLEKINQEKGLQIPNSLKIFISCASGRDY